MTPSIHPDLQLTTKQRLVLEALRGAHAPRGAYALLAQLQTEGFHAPTQVYRALDALIQRKLIYRLESLNAYIALQPPWVSDEAFIVFAVCERCGRVSQHVDPPMGRRLRRLMEDAGMTLTTPAIETRVRCIHCSAPP